MDDNSSLYQFLNTLPEEERRRFSEILKRISDEREQKKPSDEPKPRFEFFAGAVPFGYVISEKSLEKLDEPVKKDDLPDILDELTVELTKEAHEGKLQPVFGRETEIQRLMTILMRKNKSNPVLLGEAGVGKTAIVEALATRIAQGKTPKNLQNLRIFELSVASIASGTRFRGDIEEKIEDLINAMLDNPNFVLFIDELHMLYSDHSGDSNTFANMLKPYLARGEIKVIGATTFDEYRKTIEKDKALLRRFQPITIEEPDATAVLLILQNLRPIYEKFHQVKIRPEILPEILELSRRYFSSRHDPDRTLDLLDESLALAHKNGAHILSSGHLKQAIAAQTNIKNAAALTPQNINGMARNIKRQIIGQNQAIDQVSKTLRRKLLVRQANQPLGSFILMGPTGVGKTELARQLARNLTGSASDLIRFDMSEFADRESLTRLIGAPAGYIGYDDGGNLTEAVRRNPHSVILFDEIEKAHPGIYNLLLQVLDTGLASDAKGNKVSFQNTIIILTSNLGSDKVYKKSDFGFAAAGQDLPIARRTLADDARKALNKIMRQELINRFDNIVVFDPLTRQTCTSIIRKLLNDLSDQLAAQGNLVKFSTTVISWVTQVLGDDLSGGVRPIQRLVNQKITDFILENLANGELDNRSGRPRTVTIRAGKLTLK